MALKICLRFIFRQSLNSEKFLLLKTTHSNTSVLNYSYNSAHFKTARTHCVTHQVVVFYGIVYFFLKVYADRDCSVHFVELN